MNGRGGYAWFVAACDRQGNVRKMLVDQLGLCPGCSGSLHMHDVLDERSHADWQRMTAAVLDEPADSRSSSREWTLNVRHKGRSMPLYFSAARDGDGLLVAARGDHSPGYFGGAARQGETARAEILSRVSRQLVTEADANEQQQYLDEVSRLNNELVNAHRELARRHVQLEEINEYKNMLLGMAAHDIRNPLGNIRNLALFVLEKMREERLDPGGVGLEFLENVVEQSDQLLFLLADVLDLSAVESGKLVLNREDICLNQLIEDRLAIHRIFAGEKGVLMVLESGEDRIPCHADRSKLAQVLDNVFSNAVKYSHRDGRIDVTSGMEGEVVWFAVRDRGVGMSEEDQKRLFTPFARLSSRPTAGESSTGLGMTLVKRIVEGHGGWVEVESAPGKGTTVQVHLPIRAKEC